jgi:hypothetical protein
VAFRYWLRNAMSVTLDNAGATTVLDEQSFVRQWRQCQTEGALVEGISPAAWRKRLARKGLLAEPLHYRTKQ